MQCPCESEQTYQECCAPYIEEGKCAPTAEALMRSRYTAYTKHNIAYIRESLAPECRAKFDEKATAKWAKKAQWQGLEIVDTADGTQDDKFGSVSFIASYEMDGEDEAHSEDAKFRKDDNGHWYFLDQAEPVARTEAKIGRNDPCPCGSGKKFKKCCA